MTRRRRYKFLICSGLIAAVLYFAFGRNQEPSYGGHPLNYWVRARFDAQPPMPVWRPFTPAVLIPKSESEEAIRHIGTNALPHLMKWITNTPTSTQVRLETPVCQAASWLGQKFNTDWFAKHFYTGSDEQILAYGSIVALEILGTNAYPAIPDLNRFVNETDYRDRADMLEVIFERRGVFWTNRPSH